METIITSLDKMCDLLNSYNITFEIIHTNRPILTINDAKEYFEISQTAPVLIVKTEKGYFALIIAGNRGKLNFQEIKMTIRCEKMKLASKNEVLKITGFEVGNVPLVGHGLPCILDSNLLLQPFIYGGAGEANCTLKIAPRDLEKVNKIIAKI